MIIDDLEDSFFELYRETKARATKLNLEIVLYRLEQMYLISSFDDTRRICEHMGYLFSLSHEQFGLSHRTTLAT